MENISFVIKLPVACDHYLVHIPWNHVRANKEKVKKSNLRRQSLECDHFPFKTKELHIHFTFREVYLETD